MSAVPDAVLEDKRLSPTARLVLAWLLGRPPGWRFRVEHVLSTLGIGRDAWRAARQQLEQCGYLRQRRVTVATGRVGWELTVTADPIDGPTIDGKAVDGSTIDGKAVDGGPGDEYINKGYIHKVLKCSSRRIARARARDAAAAAASQKTRRARPSGLVTWVASDVPEAQRLEREATAEDLAEAVQRVRQAGREPVPGLVARELERLALAREAEARRAAAEAERQRRLAAVAIDAAALQRGAALLPAGLRARLGGVPCS